MTIFEDEYNIDDVIPEKDKPKSKKKDLFADIEEMENESYTNETGLSASSFLPSSLLKENNKKKKHKDATEKEADDWFNELMSFNTDTKINKSAKFKHDLFESAGIIGKKKKKKKKKDKDDMVDYKRVFEPEMALYKNLLVDQNRFTESLQRQYDAITSSKSSSRGVTKQITDLINNITSARSLAVQLVEKNVNTKKLIEELSLKQKKELGVTADGENMADFAATYLKQMLGNRQQLFEAGGDMGITEYTDDEMFDVLSDNIMGDDTTSRPDDVDTYLKYENQNVQIFVSIRHDEQNIESEYEFVAKDEDGNIIEDYPMPNHTKLSVNRSTDIATDIYGKKYNIIWV